MKTKKFYHTLRFKVLASILAGLALVTVPVSYFFYIEERNQEKARFQDFTTDTVNYIEGILEHEMQVRDMEGLQKSLEGITRGGEIKGAFLLNKRGEIVFSSDKGEIGKSLDIKDASCQVCHRLPLELMPGTAILEKSEKVLRSARSITNKPQCYSCHESKLKALGLLVADFPMAGLEQRISFHLNRIIIIVLSGMLITGLMGVALVDQILIRRLKKITHAAGRLRGEDLQARAEVKGEDEVGELARAFNTMADQLQASMAQIEEYSHTLEEKVAERTGELEVRVEELERFRKATIQREFRMKELKDKVKELEEELERMKGKP
ncbi:MAG: HAMP domain-containing protein [candidate division NC10 bacterium]|nr:HAMP domain-containing protein [candidate division NC10 bacterium]